MMIKKHKASILVFTLLFLTLITVFVSQLIYNTNLYAFFTKTAIDREKARTLALGGINLARVQLTAHLYKDLYKEAEKGGVADQKKKEAEEEAKIKSFLKNILPSLNRYQTFNLTEKVDGMSGELKICISSEDGKININEAFDFQKKQFKPEYAKLISRLDFKKLREKEGKTSEESGGNILDILTNFLNKRKRKLEDISQLLEIKDFRNLEFFYTPPTNNSSQERRSISLQDLFTVSSKSSQMNILLLSDALCALFGFERPKWNDAQTKKGQFDSFIKNFKTSFMKNWGNNWDFLVPIYGRLAIKFEDIKNVLSQQFDPKVYSVISCGKVGNVEQTLVAILIANNSVLDSGLKLGTKDKIFGVPAEFVKVLKIYWL